MDDDKPTQVTDEEVKDANEAEQQKWEGDFKEEDLKIPYKREEVENKKDDIKDEPIVEDDSEEIEEYADPEPIITAEDPGEFVAKDYSFEVELEGKKHTIKDPEQAEKFMEDNADKFSAAQ